MRTDEAHENGRQQIFHCVETFRVKIAVRQVYDGLWWFGDWADGRLATLHTELYADAIFDGWIIFVIG